MDCVDGRVMRHAEGMRARPHSPPQPTAPDENASAPFGDQGRAEGRGAAHARAGERARSSSQAIARTEAARARASAVSRVHRRCRAGIGVVARASAVRRVHRRCRADIDAARTRRLRWPARHSRVSERATPRALASTVSARVPGSESKRSVRADASLLVRATSSPPIRVTARTCVATRGMLDRDRANRRSSAHSRTDRPATAARTQRDARDDAASCSTRTPMCGVPSTQITST